MLIWSSLCVLHYKFLYPVNSKTNGAVNFSVLSNFISLFFIGFFDKKNDSTRHASVHLNLGESPFRDLGLSSSRFSAYLGLPW